MPEIIKIKCKDCGREFNLSDQEVTWYKEQGFTLPKRCKSCRQKRKGGNKNGK